MPAAHGHTRGVTNVLLLVVRNLRIVGESGIGIIRSLVTSLTLRNTTQAYIHTYRHAFNPRRVRQRCTLWHLMPLCTANFHNLSPITDVSSVE
uniref:SFRICE_014612 n=1 Tax=Spodoptera frugiperda TaxID=7108 RepID=A0A2H1VAT1_SPOFR